MDIELFQYISLDYDKNMQVKTDPFPHIYFPEFFQDYFASFVTSQFDYHLENSKNQFVKEDRYSAKMRSFRSTDLLCNFFYTKKWLLFQRDLLGLDNIRFDFRTHCEFHTHAINSPNGEIHNDQNIIHHLKDKNFKDVGIWENGDTAYYGRGTSPNQITTSRKMSFLYFTNNDWQDGGEFGLFKKHDSTFPTITYPPKNNSAILFPCSSHSFHSFMGYNKTIRNSIIQFSS